MITFSNLLQNGVELCSGYTKSDNHYEAHINDMQSPFDVMYPELIHCTLVSLKALQGLSALRRGYDYATQPAKGMTGNKARRRKVSIQPRVTMQRLKDRDFCSPFPLQFSSQTSFALGTSAGFGGL